MISIVIPTYNRARHLKKSLWSLELQDIGIDNFEVIVIDDGSRDGTKKIVESFENKLNIKYFCQDHGGVSVARNKGISKSSGEVIVFFDDDAMARKDWIYNINSIMEKEDIITGKVEPIKNNIWQYFAPHYGQGDKPKKSRVLLEGNCAIKKKVFDDIGKFDNNLTYGHEGKEFMDRASKKYNVMYYPDIVIFHDYTSGIFNYLNKQYKFGNKMAYLKINEIKSLNHLFLNYKEIKKDKEEGDEDREPVNLEIGLIKKTIVMIIAKIGSLAHFWGAINGYRKYKNK